MAVLNDYNCPQCDTESHDQWSDNIPRCCGMEMRLMMPHLHMFEWGGPRTISSIRDEPFSSRSELNRWAKDKKMSLGEASEKVGGARNDMYDGIGKTYSYAGASKRDNPLANRPKGES